MNNDSRFGLRVVILIVGGLSTLLSALAVWSLPDADGTEIRIKNMLSRTIAASQELDGRFGVLSSSEERRWHTDNPRTIGVASPGLRLELTIDEGDAQTIEIVVSRPPEP